METEGKPTARTLMALGAIVCAAAALRLVGLKWGLPDATHLFSYHPDEICSLMGTTALLDGSLNPHFFNYGSLYLYLVAAACVIGSGGLMFGSPPIAATYAGIPPALRAFYLDARVVTVILALVTVAVVFALGSRIAGRRAGLLAALFIAIFPLHVVHSHYATVDVPLTLFVALALLSAVGIARGAEGWRTYLLAGLMCGLAASTKYNGALVLVAPLAAHLWPQEGSAGALVRLRDWRWLLLPAGLAVGFALSSPYVVLDWPTASGMIAFLGSQVQAGEGLALAAEPNGWLFHLKGVVIACGLPALLLACAGAVMAIRQRRRDVLPLLVFGMVWVVVIATSGLRYQRYELPLLPVAAVLAALAVEELLRHRQARARRLAAAAAVLAAGVALWASTAYVTCNFAGLAGRSRDVMLQELVARVPESATVGVVARPWFSIAPVNYQNGGAIMGRFPVWQQYEAQLRPVIVTGADRVWLQQRRPDYFLLSEFDIRDGLRRGCDPATVRFMEALEADYALVYETPARLCKACWPAFGFVPHDWLYPAPWQRLYARKGER